MLCFVILMLGSIKVGLTAAKFASVTSYQLIFIIVRHHLTYISVPFDLHQCVPFSAAYSILYVSAYHLMYASAYHLIYVSAYPLTYISAYHF